MSGPTHTAGAWSLLRDQFELEQGWLHLALCMVTCNPRPVREEIQRHRQGLDQNPALYYRNNAAFVARGLAALARYLGTDPDQVALVESTTAGLSVVLNGLDLKPGHEVISSCHDHYSLDMTLRGLAANRAIPHRRIRLYREPAKASHGEILANLTAAITPATRAVCLTWVHSCSGVRLPLACITAAIAAINEQRPEAERILTVVDGVHGMGVVAFRDIASLGCDFLVSGLHKWMFGPRGTGFVWGTARAWLRFRHPLIVSFDPAAFHPWRYQEHEQDPCPPARRASTGGFQAFEHRWAIHQAIGVVESLGQERIQERIQAQLQLLRQCLVRHPRVTCLTPESPDLSAGLLCFQVHGVEPRQVVEDLLTRRLITGQTPYRNSAVRLAPSILLADDEISQTTRILENYLDGH